MIGPKLDTAVDLWAVRVLCGYASRMRVSTFRLLVSIGLAVLAPVAMAGTLFVLDLVATLLTQQPNGSSAHADAAAGLGTVLTIALCYTCVADLVRTHFSSAVYLISRSPLRGLWLAADISLWRVVAAERGAAFGSRALFAFGALGGVALLLHRASHPGADDVLAIAVMLPLAYLAAAVALTVRHACSDRRPGTGGTLFAVLGPLTLVAGFAVARLARGADIARLADAERPGVTQARAGLLNLGGQLGWARLLVLGLLILATAAVTIVAAGDHDLPVTVRDRPRQRPPRTDALSSTLLRGVGGVARMHVSLRATGLVALAALAAAGWRLGGGSALPDTAVDPISRTLAFGAATVGMVIAAGTLTRVGQTSRLWHYRTLWEHGLSATTLFRAAVTPSAALALTAAAACTVLHWLLTGRWSATMALVLCGVVTSEHLVDSLFARGVATEDSRTTNSLLAIVGYLFAIPAMLLGVSLYTWAVPALVLLLVIEIGGGAWWFHRRLHALPIMVVE